MYRVCISIFYAIPNNLTNIFSVLFHSVVFTDLPIFLVNKKLQVIAIIARAIGNYRPVPECMQGVANFVRCGVDVVIAYRLECY